MMMIHKPWGISGGNAGDMRDYADLLDKVENRVNPCLCQKNGQISTRKLPPCWRMKPGWMGKRMP